MDPDENVCLCFRVSLRKLRTFMEREAPRVPSQLSECLGAGTGCHWCVPFLTRLHEQWQRGETPDLRISPERYAANRARYRESGERPAESLSETPERSSAENSGEAPPAEN